MATKPKPDAKASEPAVAAVPEDVIDAPKVSDEVAPEAAPEPPAPYVATEPEPLPEGTEPASSFVQDIQHCSFDSRVCLNHRSLQQWHRRGAA